MESCSASHLPRTFVAIDIAKHSPEVRLETTNVVRQLWRMANRRSDYDQLRQHLALAEAPALIGLEATGVYHRPLEYFLH